MTRVPDRVLALFLVCLVFLAFETAVAGRGDKAGTSGAPELMIPVGARDIALAGSSVSTTTGVDAIFWNPAGLSRSSKNAEALFSYMNYIADISVDYFAVGANFEGFGTLGVSLKTLSFGQMEITTEDVPDGSGEMFSPTYVTIGLTYSRLLTDRISVGITTNLISERIDRVNATGFSFDFGVQYSNFASVGGLNIGVVVKNIGPGMKFEGAGLLRDASATSGSRPSSPLSIEAQTDQLPSVIELGVSYRRQLDEQNALSGTALFQNNNLSFDEYKFGLEYGFNNLLFVRGGYVFYPAAATSESRTYGGTLGAGVHYAFGGIDITVDYAYRAVQFLDANHVFAVKLGF